MFAPEKVNHGKPQERRETFSGKRTQQIQEGNKTKEQDVLESPEVFSASATELQMGWELLDGWMLFLAS